MKYRLIGFVGIITGIYLLASQFISIQGDRVYINPPGAQEDAFPVEIQSSERSAVCKVSISSVLRCNG
ncbi:hypothetical protein [Paenibacillus sp. sgz302251]|uniref:hypothetical protein n=1 Tax=Paenibacillus sp. sgz302251 TaxID=3414493 RepID=UPI003C7B85C9